MQDCFAELVLPPAHPDALTNLFFYKSTQHVPSVKYPFLQFFTISMAFKIKNSNIIVKVQLHLASGTFWFLFFFVSSALVYSHLSTDSFPTLLAPCVLIWSLFGLFYHSFLNKATQNIYGKRNITTVPLHSQNESFQIGLHKICQFFGTGQI